MRPLTRLVRSASYLHALTTALLPLFLSAAYVVHLFNHVHGGSAFCLGSTYTGGVRRQLDWRCPAPMSPTCVAQSARCKRTLMAQPFLLSCHSQLVALKSASTCTCFKTDLPMPIPFRKMSQSHSAWLCLLCRHTVFMHSRPAGFSIFSSNDQQILYVPPISSWALLENGRLHSSLTSGSNLKWISWRKKNWPQFSFH